MSVSSMSSADLKLNLLKQAFNNGSQKDICYKLLLYSLVLGSNCACCWNVYIPVHVIKRKCTKLYASSLCNPKEYG